MKYKYRFKVLHAPPEFVKANLLMSEFNFSLEGAIEIFLQFNCDRDDLTTEIFRPILQAAIEEEGGKLYHIEGGKIS
jgi:hypothetical protein